MSLSTAMFASVSGLTTASTAISVIGDNIANVSTPGFKERRAEFSDVLGQSISTSGGFAQTGSGSRVGNVSQIFTQGTFESTSRSTDMAIEGGGFFVLEGNNGRSYARAGMHFFDNSGTLVDSAGRRLQGFGIDPISQSPTGQLGDIVVNTSVAPPQASGLIDLSLNLQATAPLVGPFDVSSSFGTSNHQAVVDVYDSLGAEHEATIHFTRTASNAWEWNTVLNVSDTSLPPANVGDTTVVQGSGTLAFNPDGTLQAAAGAPVTFQFSGGAAPAQVIDINFGNLGAGSRTTQFDFASVINQKSQDGFGPGSFAGLSIGPDGFVTVSFSSGVTRAVAQVALANFASVENLNSVGNNAFVETRESGQPLIGGPNSGQFGAVKSNSLEQSNVDLASQFVRLILNQRAFQANTRTVSTTNELLANLVQLGQ